MNKKGLIILISTLVVILAAGVALYPKLTAGYTPDRALPDNGARESNNPINEEGPVINSPGSASAESSPDGSGNAENGESASAAPDAADFTVYLEDGTSVKLSDNFGKPIIINFWATWCGPCKAELPHFDDMYLEYGDSISFMMVNLTDGIRDTVKGVSSFLTTNNYSFPVYYDVEYSAAYAYNIMSIPETVLIDSNGNIVDTIVGTLSEEDLQTCINLLLSEG